MQKITPFLWFNNNAAEAMNFYVSVFKEARILSTQNGPDGTLFGGTFELQGQRFNVLNGGPQFTFTPAISFFISCEDQSEVDYYWEKLSEGGKTNQCGWLDDKFGLTWQVVPTTLGKLLSDPDAKKSARVMQVMRTMTKIDIAALEAAAQAEQ